MICLILAVILILVQTLLVLALYIEYLYIMIGSNIGILIVVNIVVFYHLKKEL